MVKEKNIGIIGIQGAIAEHEKKFKKIFDSKGIPGDIRIINKNDDITEIDGLVIPGGESITISKALFKSDLYESILKRIKENTISIMGTCAGCVLLASEIIDDKYKINIFKAMDMKVKRNAFGHQKESFESNIKIKKFQKPFSAVFIRAPVITETWGKCEVLAKLNDKIILAKQDKFLALSFHPELSEDNTIHKYFIDMI